RSRATRRPRRTSGGTTTTRTTRPRGRSSARAGGPHQSTGELPQVLGQLGRLVNVEVDAEDRDSPREPSEVVVTRSELAGAFVLRLDRPPVRRNVRGEVLRGGVECDSGFVRGRAPGDA